MLGLGMRQEGSLDVARAFLPQAADQISDISAAGTPDQTGQPNQHVAVLAGDPPRRLAQLDRPSAADGPEPGLSHLVGALGLAADEERQPDECLVGESPVHRHRKLPRLGGSSDPLSPRRNSHSSGTV